MIARQVQIGPPGTRLQNLLPHLIAGTLALLYAWAISNTRLVTTGVQFVSPLAVVLATHLVWNWAFGRLDPGYARALCVRTLMTAAGIMFGVVLLAIYAPAPAQAAGSVGQYVMNGLAILACLAVLALVIFVVAGSVYLLVRLLDAILHLVLRWIRRPPGSGGNKLNDFGVVILAFFAIGASSLEGVLPAITVSANDHASSTVAVNAPPARVWQKIGTATSPGFALPMFLRSIPQPVAVVVDEGAELGAKRVVRFSGREGEGDLTLKVTERTDHEVVFQAMSDTSPIAGWVTHKRLTFIVEPDGKGTLLTVSSDYDRLLSPAWFFKPYIGLASYLAVNVLARDTKQRAEVR